MANVATLRKIQAFGKDAAFMANVVLNWHSEPAAKLKGILYMLQRGHDVRIAAYSIDTPVVDGFRVSWQDFEYPAFLRSNLMQNKRAVS